MNILKMVPIGRSASYNQSNAIAIPQHKLQVWPGYVIGIDKYKGGLLLMCDVSHKVLREQTAYDIMYVTLLSLTDRKSTRLNSSHVRTSRMPSSA